MLIYSGQGAMAEVTQKSSVVLLSLTCTVVPSKKHGWVKWRSKTTIKILIHRDFLPGLFI